MTLLALLLVLVHAPQKQGFKHQKYGEVTGNIAKWSREERQGRKGNNTKGQLCCEQLELSSLGNTISIEHTVSELVHLTLTMSWRLLGEWCRINSHCLLTLDSREGGSWRRPGMTKTPQSHGLQGCLKHLQVEKGMVQCTKAGREEWGAKTLGTMSRALRALAQH